MKYGFSNAARGRVSSIAGQPPVGKPPMRMVVCQSLGSEMGHLPGRALQQYLKNAPSAQVRYEIHRFGRRHARRAKICAGRSAAGEASLASCRAPPYLTRVGFKRRKKTHHALRPLSIALTNTCIIVVRARASTPTTPKPQLSQREDIEKCRRLRPGIRQLREFYTVIKKAQQCRPVCRGIAAYCTPARAIITPSCQESADA